MNKKEQLAFKKSIADRATVLRKEAGFSQEEIADFLGLTRVSVTNMECGRQPYSSEYLWMLSSLYKCSVGDFFPPSAAVQVDERATKRKVVTKEKMVKKFTFKPFSK